MSHRHHGKPQEHSAHSLAVETELRKDNAVGHRARHDAHVRARLLIRAWRCLRPAGRLFLLRFLGRVEAAPQLPNLYHIVVSPRISFLFRATY